MPGKYAIPLKDYKIKLLNQTLWLHPERVAYWEERRMLLIADLHLGKAGHFRKAGIPVPCGVHHQDLQRLARVMAQYSPKRVLILGDLFHSEHNGDWEDFTRFVQSLRGSAVTLVSGNHDVLEAHRYRGIEKCDESLHCAPFVFTHKPLKTTSQAGNAVTTGHAARLPDAAQGPNIAPLYNICGHVHPAVRIPSGIKQRVRTPCFVFGEKQALMPAFGLFTGTYVTKPRNSDGVYAIVEDQIIEIKT